MLAGLCTLAGAAVAGAQSIAPPPPPVPAPAAGTGPSLALGVPWCGRLVRGLPLAAGSGYFFTWDLTAGAVPNPRLAPPRHRAPGIAAAPGHRRAPPRAAGAGPRGDRRPLAAPRGPVRPQLRRTRPPLAPERLGRRRAVPTARSAREPARPAGPDRPCPCPGPGRPLRGGRSPARVRGPGVWAAADRPVWWWRSPITSTTCTCACTPSARRRRRGAAPGGRCKRSPGAPAPVRVGSLAPAAACRPRSPRRKDGSMRSRLCVLLSAPPAGPSLAAGWWRVGRRARGHGGGGQAPAHAEPGRLHRLCPQEEQRTPDPGTPAHRRGPSLTRRPGETR